MMMSMKANKQTFLPTGVNTRGDIPRPIAPDPVSRAPRRDPLPAADPQPSRAAWRAGVLGQSCNYPFFNITIYLNF